MLWGLQKQIINTDTDDLKEITRLKCKLDMNLLFKGSDSSKVSMNFILKCWLSLILNCGMENKNQQTFIALRLLYILYVIVYFTVEECAFSINLYIWVGGWYLPN